MNGGAEGNFHGTSDPGCSDWDASPSARAAVYTWWAFRTSVELRGGDLLSFWWGIKWMDSYHWGPLATAGSVSSLWQMASRRLSAHLSFWHDLSVLPLACGWAVLRLAQEQFHPMLEANFAYVRRWFLRLTKPVY